ncbi:MAG: disulfide bond formation protein B [Burkholderiales bacterium]|nr:disulfide bond formation protein B [Burkholderiales bacterium]
MTPRIGYAIGALLCAGLLAFALYLQHVEMQEPCPLCILQRMAYIVLMIVFLIAAVHGPGRTGRIVYGGILFAVAGIGAAIAARHVWLQNLPEGQVPECGPGLQYMLEQFPLTQALEKILAGSGECAEAGWTLLGLTIAGWSLVWLIVLGAFAVFLAVRGERRVTPEYRA